MRDSHYQYFLQEKNQRRIQADRVLDILLECESSPRYSRYTLLEELAFKCSLYDTPFESNQDEEQSIRISTIHSAKGLEYPFVIVAGCHRKFPLKRSDTCLIHKNGLHVSDGSEESTSIRKYFFDTELEATIEEEKRLFYVACTRAQHYLVLTGLANKCDSTSYLNFLKQLPDFNINQNHIEFTNNNKLFSFECIQQGHVLPDNKQTQNISKTNSNTHPLFLFPESIPIATQQAISSLGKTSSSKNERISIHHLHYANMGTVVHDGMMSALTQTSFTVMTFLNQHPLFHLLTPELQQRCKKTIEQSIHHECFKSLDLSAIRCEYPVTGTINDLHVGGRVDIVEKSKHTIHIIEIKTDVIKDSKELITHYAQQLEGYIACFKHLFPDYSHISCTLFSTTLNKAIHYKK